MIIRRYGVAILLSFMILFLLSAFLLLSFREGAFDAHIMLAGGIFAAFVLVQYNVLAAVFRRIDRYVLLITDFLQIISVIMLYRMKPETGERQIIWILIGTVLMVIALTVVRRAGNFGRWNLLFMILAVGLLGVTLVLAQRTGGALNWLQIGPFSFQPSEFAKILFLIVTAYYLSTRQHRRDLWPYFLFTILCVLLLVAARDLGAALLFAGTFLIVFYVGTGSLWITLGAIGAFAGGAVASYYIFGHVRTRVQVWRDPWATYNENGYQIVQGLLAIASGGLLGSGLGNGMPQSIPVAESDYMFAAICEEFGIIVGVALIGFYLLFIVRGVLIAMDARTKFAKLLVFGATCLLALQSFIIIGGVIKMIPLTGITMPFVSYGGSSMLSSMMVLGIIEGIAVQNGEYEEAEIAEMGGQME
ncbi:MAG: FtsW/RodA/SpoVE family cell cycle protein [Clostridia bacterium]|nr:FtsW/RodA/SpoVE family cell cycle protein [Clostridia bacterium]